MPLVPLMSTPREPWSRVAPNVPTRVPEESYSAIDERRSEYTWWVAGSMLTALGLLGSITPWSTPVELSLWSDWFHWTAQIVPSVSTAMSQGLKPTENWVMELPAESNLSIAGCPNSET